MANKHEEICFLCGKRKSEVEQMLKGKFGYVCFGCVNEAYEVICNMDDEDVDNNVKMATPSQIKAHLDQYVIGQDNAKRTLAVAVYNHYKRMRQTKKSDVEIQKSNILMIGSTGSGKTYLAQSLAKFLGVPFAIADATTLTQAGYVGDDVETMLRTLWENADYDVDLAEQGIIYIDEIDKIARKSENTSITRDVGGEGVQQALLKIIEGTISEVPINGNRKHPNGEIVKIDTSKILFICGGAFEGLDKVINKKSESKAIGFNADITPKSIEDKADYGNVQPSDVIKFGLTPELVGRLPILCTLDSLKEDDLLRILTEPKNALVKQYQKLMSMDGIELEFTEDALKRVASLALERNIGARGLRAILEKCMEKVMFTAPDNKNVKKVVITSDVVDGKSEADMYTKSDKKIA